VSDTTHGRADAAHLRQCLAALERQAAPPPMEIIVPHYPQVAGLDEVKAEFPQVRFVSVADLASYTGAGGSREHHDELRARGLAEARGGIVALLEDHGVPQPGWSAAIVAAHRSDFSAIGGPIDNGVDRPLNWAVYFCDFGRYQSPLPEGVTAFASDANISYKRVILEELRPVWEEVFREPEVNGAIQERGGKLGIAPAMIVHQCRRLRLGEALAERFIWGRSYASARPEVSGFPRRALFALFSPALPLLMLARMFASVTKKKRSTGAFLRAVPITAALSVSWACGEFVGYATGRAGRDRGDVHRSRAAEAA
jgi:hypothetical protein